MEKNWEWTKESWVRCLMLLWLYMMVRGALAENPYEALRRSVIFVRYFTFACALAFWTLRDDLTLKRFLNVLTAAVVFMAADGLLQRLAGRDIFFRPYTHLSDGSLRLTGPYRNPILGIMLAWLSFPVWMRWVMAKEGKVYFGRSIFLILFIISIIMLSGERVALLLTLFGWLIAIFLMPVRKIYPLAAFTLGALLIGALASFSHEIFDRQIMSTVRVLSNWHDSAYGMLLDSDLKVAQVQPLFGIGANHFRIVCPRFYPGMDEKLLPAVCNLHPHNIYLEWFIEQGIIGFALFLAFIVLAARQIITLWPHERTNPYFVGCVIAFIIRLWPFVSSTTFFSPFGAPSFWMVLGILLAYRPLEPVHTAEGLIKHT